VSARQIQNLSERRLIVLLSVGAFGSAASLRVTDAQLPALAQTFGVGLALSGRARLAERARALATSDSERCEASAELGAIHLARGRTDAALLAYREGVAKERDLWCNWSEKYINWRQLEILGLMSKGNWT